MQLPTLRDTLLANGAYALRDEGGIDNPDLVVPITETFVELSEGFLGNAPLNPAGLMVATEVGASLGGVLDAIYKGRVDGTLDQDSSEYNGDLVAAVKKELDALADDYEITEAGVPVYQEVLDAVSGFAEKIAEDYGQMSDIEIVNVKARLGETFGALAAFKKLGDDFRSTVN